MKYIVLLCFVFMFSCTNVKRQSNTEQPVITSSKFTEGLSIYVESWNNITFRDPRISNANGYAKWHDKSAATIIASQYLAFCRKTARVQIGKAFSMGHDSYESDLESVEQWLISLGYTSISMWDSAGDRDSEMVRKYPK